MRTRVALAYLFIAAFAHAEEANTTALEQAYRAAADHLASQLPERFADPKTCQEVFEWSHKANARIYEVSVASKETFGWKKPVEKFTEPVQLKLESVSRIPPFLRQDPNDLYHRYHSSVVVRFNTFGADENLKWRGYELVIPVSATPELQWAFPTGDDVIEAATVQCNRTAQAEMDWVKSMWDKILEYQKITGKHLKKKK